MNTVLKTVAAASVAILTTLPVAADTKWVSGLPGDVDLDIAQLFKINVEGTSGKDSSLKISAEGTAFAISENMLITARHVPQDATAFANAVPGGKIQIPSRTVEYRFARDKDATLAVRPFKVASVTPAATPTIDASRLNLGKSRAVPFKLSVCDIEEGQQYYLLKFRDGKIEFPRAVPITADVEAYTDHGEARRFTHAALTVDTPKEGDSGSPILDEKGHVIGLLTAIQPGVLYVTTTRSFYDLVPPSVDVECADRVRKKDVETLDSGLRAMLDSAVQAVTEDFDAKMVALKKEHDETITELEARLARATSAANATIRVLKKIDAEGGLTDLEPAIYQKIIEDLKSQRPVIPQVQQMFKDLGVERWSFAMLPTNLGQSLQVTARYERDISRPRYSEKLQFCLRPLKRAQTLDLQDELDDAKNIESKKFYRLTDRMINGEEGMTCQFTEHTKAPLAEQQKEDFDEEAYPFKSGSYSFNFLSTPPVDEELPVWTGLYYGIMFVDTDDDDPKNREITHRFIFETDPENRTAAPKCYLFENNNGRGDAFATFIQADLEEREATQRCTNL